MPKRRWSEMSPRQRKLVVLGGVLQMVLATVAGRNLARRPAEQVRGPKLAWSLALTVNTVGPLAYLIWGRRR
jgi:hypothetical protein